MTEDVSSTPAARRRNRIRASILEAAEEVFATDGEEGLSIRRLADAIDYSPAAIYKYFGSKDELVNELKEAFFAQILEKTAELEAHGGSFHERARMCVSGYINTALEKPHHYAAAFSGVRTKSEAGRDDFYADNKGQAFLVLFNMVKEGQALGCIRSDIPPMAAAKSVWASCHGIASLMAHLPDFPNHFPDDGEMSREDFINLHVEQIMRGFELNSAKTIESDRPSGTRTKS